MNKNQFGFVPGMSIEECKASVFAEIKRVKRYF